MYLHHCDIISDTSIGIIAKFTSLLVQNKKVYSHPK